MGIPKVDFGDCPAASKMPPTCAPLGAAPASGSPGFLPLSATETVTSLPLLQSGGVSLRVPAQAYLDFGIVDNLYRTGRVTNASRETFAGWRPAALGQGVRNSGRLQVAAHSGAKAWEGPVDVRVSGRKVDAVTGIPALLPRRCASVRRTELFAPIGSTVLHLGQCAGD